MGTAVHLRHRPTGGIAPQDQGLVQQHHPHGPFTQVGTALAVALVVGTIITVLEPRWHRFLPSPTAVGMGMLIPGFAIIPMVAGGVVQAIWLRRSPRTEATYSMPLASGFITGEALVVLVFSIMAIFGIRV